MIQVLNPLKDQNMEETLANSSDGSEDRDPMLEAEDDMVISQYQKDIKLEALARRSPSNRGNRPKKGKKSPTS